MAILDIENYPAVRAAIDISISEKNLPDEVIALSIYQGAAERWVLDRDADAETYAPAGAAADAAKWARIQNAAIYRTAALICPAVPNITRDDFGPNESYTRKAMDYERRAEELTDLASAELASYLQADPVTSQMPTFFTVGPGYRGR